MTGVITIPTRDSAPEDDMAGFEAGDIAIYARGDRDDMLHARPHGGAERLVNLGTAAGEPGDVTADRELGTQYTNDTGRQVSAAVGILVSEDIGATNANKQGLVSTELAVGDTRLARHFWDELKLFSDGAGTVVSVVLQHEFDVAPGQTYRLSVLDNDFASVAIDTWVEREW